MAFHRSYAVDIVSLVRLRLFGMGALGGIVHGGRLVERSYLVSRTPEAYELLLREGVTVLNSRRRHLANLSGSTMSGYPTLALRVAIFGGEALNVAS